MNNDVISRSAVLEFLCKGCNARNNTPIPSCGEPCSDFKYISKLPALDVAPVVHAEWKDHCCTNCFAMCVTARSPQGWVYNIETRYCPNCGAKMDATSNVPEKDVGGFGGVINAVD